MTMESNPLLVLTIAVTVGIVYCAILKAADRLIQFFLFNKK